MSSIGIHVHLCPLVTLRHNFLNTTQYPHFSLLKLIKSRLLFLEFFFSIPSLVWLYYPHVATCWHYTLDMLAFSWSLPTAHKLAPELTLVFLFFYFFKWLFTPQLIPFVVLSSIFLYLSFLFSNPLCCSAWETGVWCSYTLNTQLTVSLSCHTHTPQQVSHKYCGQSIF